MGTLQVFANPRLLVESGEGARKSVLRKSMVCSADLGAVGVKSVRSVVSDRF